MVPAASVLQSLCLHTIFLQTTRLPYSWNSDLLCQPTTAWNLFMHDTCIFAQKIKVAQGKIHTCQRLLVSAPSTVADWVLIPLTQAWKMGSSCSLNPPDSLFRRARRSCTGWCRHGWAQGHTAPCSGLTSLFILFPLFSHSYPSFYCICF